MATKKSAKKTKSVKSAAPKTARAPKKKDRQEELSGFARLGSPFLPVREGLSF
jgi:hypothetical protein